LQHLYYDKLHAHRNHGRTFWLRPFSLIYLYIRVPLYSVHALHSLRKLTSPFLSSLSLLPFSPSPSSSSDDLRRQSLDQKIEKHSPSLNRTAVYTEKSRMSRLPSVLTVHLVRFYWRRDTNSKAKIMFVLISPLLFPFPSLPSQPGLCGTRPSFSSPSSGLLTLHDAELPSISSLFPSLLLLAPKTRRKVKFPFTFDALDLCTPQLRSDLTPVNTALKNIAKDRDERAKIRKRIAKGQTPAAANNAVAGKDAGPTASGSTSAGGEPSAMAVDGAEDKKKEEGDDELYGGTEEEERKKREEEGKTLRGLVAEGIKKDVGANESGLYELAAIVTHKGSSADSGHYIGSLPSPSFALVLFWRRLLLAASSSLAVSSASSEILTRSPSLPPSLSSHHLPLVQDGSRNSPTPLPLLDPLPPPLRQHP
jgi:hypothetical protein